MSSVQTNDYPSYAIPKPNLKTSIAEYKLGDLAPDDSFIVGPILGICFSFVLSLICVMIYFTCRRDYKKYYNHGSLSSARDYHKEYSFA